MKVDQNIYLKIIYMTILFLAYCLGNTIYGTPMRSYTYAIFLVICMYYYLTDFLEFNRFGGRFRPWITSFMINISLAIFLWTFSKSELLYFKFAMVWMFSNSLREIFLKFEGKKVKAIFVGPKEEYEEYRKNSRKKYFEFISLIDPGIAEEKLLRYIDTEKVELVVIQNDIIDNNPKEFLDLKLKGIKVFLPWQYKETIEEKIDVKSISNKWFLDNQGFEILSNTFEKKIKRIVDIIAISIIGILTLPIIILTAIVIKIVGLIDKTDAGPVFFKQVRMGLGNRSFEIIKFRTMKTKEHWAGVGFNPEEESWTEKDDPRVTKLGKFLRETRIDELPQLLNVLKGDMSFVGPRPESLSYVKVLERKVPFYSLRHTVLPGLTGWAQVRYPYGASVEDALRKLEYDLYYIKHQDFMLDLMILFKTMKVVLSRRGM